MRRCQRIGCENSIDHLRADAAYCGPTCKREAARQARFSHDGAASPAFWSAYNLIRRRKRCTTRLSALAAALAVVLAVAGCGGGHHHTASGAYKTLPAPALPAGVTAPSTSSCTTGDNHSMGSCLPKLASVGPPSRSAVPGPRCVDVSNNDPVFGVAAWRRIKAAGFTCAVDKVSEGIGFIDRTAAQMAHDQRAAGLIVGAYAFQHVCEDSAVTEADIAVRVAQADHLVGGGALPLTADSEYPTGAFGCNARAWLFQWLQEASRLLNAPLQEYTGAWWWNPHVGCWWQARYAWISGYVSSIASVPRACGRSQIDLWQYTDRAFNGVNSTDASAWQNGPAAFAVYARTSPPAASCGIFPARRFVIGLGGAVSFPTPVKASECNTVGTWRSSHCKDPVRRPVCKSSHYHAALLRDREWWIAHHRLTRHGWVPVRRPRWVPNHLGARFQVLSRIVTGH